MLGQGKELNMQHAVHNRATIRVADRTDVSGRVTAAVLVTNQSQIHGREAIERLKQLSARFLLAAGIMLLSVASYGQTPINSVPFTITSSGDYFLNKGAL